MDSSLVRWRTYGGMLSTASSRTVRSPRPTVRLIAASACVLVLSGCGSGEGGSSATPGANRSVTLAWAPNHETGVNSAGGGYQVAISGQPAINVPFTSGLAAPTSTVVTLHSGKYQVTVSAYAALDAQGGATGGHSEASTPLTVIVP